MVLSMDRWVGKVAVVTGASAGCGASIVTHLVENGVIVAGLARNKDKLVALSKKLEGKKGKFHAVQADVGKEQDVLNALKWTSEKLGPIHILINNAGINKLSSYLDGKTEDWLAIFQTNVIGLSTVTREVVKDMRANNTAGHIIHINSTLGHTVAHTSFLNVYPASKFAVTALTETLRQELNSINSNIKITSISPGAIDTEFGGGDALFASIPKLQTDDVVDAVMYVLSTPPHVQVHDVILRTIGSAV